MATLKYAKGINYKMAIYQACISLFQRCMYGLWLNVLLQYNTQGFKNIHVIMENKHD